MTHGLAMCSFSRDMSSVGASSAPAPPVLDVRVPRMTWAQRLQSIWTYLVTMPSRIRPTIEPRITAISDVHAASLLDTPDPRLPFDCPPDMARSHIVDLPDNIVPQTTVVVVRFEVKDNGIGLSAEQQEQLFKPYSQVGAMCETVHAKYSLTLKLPAPLRLTPSDNMAALGLVCTYPSA